MVEKIHGARVVCLLDDARSKGELILSAFADDGCPFAIAMQAGMGATKERDNSVGVARAHVAPSRGRERFNRCRQVHRTGIAGQEDVALIDKGSQF